MKVTVCDREVGKFKKPRVAAAVEQCSCALDYRCGLVRATTFAACAVWACIMICLRSKCSWKLEGTPRLEVKPTEGGLDVL